MSPAEFDVQMNRVTQTFGEGKVYNRERLALIWKAVNDLSAPSFSRIVDNFIASARYAPLPKDFQESAYAERRHSFNREVDGAAKAMDREWPTGLKGFLEREYPGAKTLNDAVEIQIEKNKIAKALKENT
jgi:hypothetical protein